MKRFLVGYKLFYSDLTTEYEVEGESVIEVAAIERQRLSQSYHLPIFSIKVEELD